jgi:hypothetical protein
MGQGMEDRNFFDFNVFKTGGISLLRPCCTPYFFPSNLQTYFGAGSNHVKLQWLPATVYSHPCPPIKGTVGVWLCPSNEQWYGFNHEFGFLS